MPTAGSGTAAAAPTANAGDPAGYVPDITDLGYTTIPSAQGEISQPGARILRSDFQVAGERPRKVTIYIYTHDRLTLAQDAYISIRDALRNPPPEAFGGGQVTQEDIEGPDFGDERHSYRVTRIDSNGNRIWSDIYRFGDVIAVVQVLDRETIDAQIGLRTELASRIEELVTD